MGARGGTDKTVTTVFSEIVTVGTVAILANTDTSKAHCFVGAQFFGSADETDHAVPDAGQIEISVRTLNTMPITETIPDAIIFAEKPCTLGWAGNTQDVIATPSGITVATHYRIVATFNET